MCLLCPSDMCILFNSSIMIILNLEYAKVCATLLTVCQRAEWWRETHTIWHEDEIIERKNYLKIRLK